MVKDQNETADRFIDPKASLSDLRRAAEDCTGCDLYKHATQTVFGEGPSRAAVLLVGEQPGDAEDREGHPFVGPAGRMLDKALAEAGLDRRQVYVTNVVKHFKWIVRGKRRLHQTPRAVEIEACFPWLRAEIERVRPQVVVCLGATAAKSVLGKSFRVTRERGKPIPSEVAGCVVATVHPSSLLRAPDPETRAREYGRFVADLRSAVRATAASE